MIGRSGQRPAPRGSRFFFIFKKIKNVKFRFGPGRAPEKYYLGQRGGGHLSGSRNRFPCSHTRLPNHKKKQEKCCVATKVSFVATNQPFVDRLDTFSIARVLKITLVLLFSDEIHCLLSIWSSLGRELPQGRFLFCIRI